MQILFLLETAFSVWMLMDAARRRADAYWFFVILMPFGELVYFFAVKMRDPGMQQLSRRLFQGRVGLDELVHLAQTTPSMHNRLQLAQGLYDHRRFSEARAAFELVLGMDEENKDALYGLGLACAAAGQDDEALSAFERLKKIDFSYKSFAAGGEQAALLWKKDRRDEALALMRSVAKRSQRFDHQVELSLFLVKGGETAEARELLEKGLADWKTGPPFARKRDAVWAKRAEALLQKIG